MNIDGLQEVVAWTSLLALGLCAAAAMVFWFRFRAWPAAVVFLSTAAVVVVALLIQAFPAYGLARHPQTGEQVLVGQNQMLQRWLYGVMGLAVLTVPVGFWWLLGSVVPKQRSQTD